MCVAVIVPKDASWPTLEQLSQMEDANKHGGGIAWVEDNKVLWKKGIKAEEMFAIIQTIKPPALIHFRIATEGGIIPELCHPFPISPEASTKLEGAAESVLVHNGHWGPWKQHLMHLAPLFCAKEGKKLPGGKWSDTRGIAFVTAVYGRTTLSLIEEKIGVLNKDGSWEKFGDFWTEQKGLHFSNMLWEHKVFSKKSDNDYKSAWEKAENYYDSRYQGSSIQGSVSEKVDEKDVATDSKGVYLSKEAEEANAAVAIAIMKDADEKKVKLALVRTESKANDMQIVNGA